MQSKRDRINHATRVENLTPRRATAPKRRPATGPDGETRRDVAHTHPSRLRASRNLAARTDRVTVTLLAEYTGLAATRLCGTFSGGANGCGNRRRARRVFRTRPEFRMNARKTHEFSKGLIKNGGSIRTLVRFHTGERAAPW